MAARRAGSGRRTPRLTGCVDRLVELAPARVETDPWRLILLENVVYLVDDAARERAFAALERLTGCGAKALLRCPDELLHEVCGNGRMAANQVRKLRQCAVLFTEVGDPRELVALPRAAAKKALKRFPGVGDPGFDRLRVRAGVEPVLAVDSNGLRVLLRLGYGAEAKSYAQSYRSAIAAASAELPQDCEQLVQAAERLRALGRTICRNTSPRCGECPLRRGCPSAG